MAALTFRAGDHIFLICSLKNHTTRFVIFSQKYLEIFWKFSSFLVQKFSNLFFWIHRLKLFRMVPFIFVKYFLVLFGHFLRFLALKSMSSEVKFQKRPKFFKVHLGTCLRFVENFFPKFQFILQNIVLRKKNRKISKENVLRFFRK
jgi:hypothetical protein